MSDATAAPINTRVILTARPKPGLLAWDSFAIDEAPVPEPGAGEFRVRNVFLSLDPAMRGWVNEGRSYVAPVAIGAVMRGFAAGYVEASNHPGFKPGDAVAGLFGAQRFAISDGHRVVKADETIAHLPSWLGGLGMPGLTAYFGLLEVGQPKPGETVVVSAASGAVGAVVGQIAMIMGCRAVGIAGGAAKCRALTETLGFDAAIDYKAGNLAADLKVACPDGIDVYYDNVGGDVLDTVLPLMNTFGRIPLCGLISAYTATSLPPGPKNMRAVLTQRLRIQGLIVFDWADRVDEAVAALAGWVKDGRLRLREDVREGGLAIFVEVVNLLYTGGNNGKLVMRI